MMQAVYGATGASILLSRRLRHLVFCFFFSAVALPGCNSDILGA